MLEENSVLEENSNLPGMSFGDKPVSVSVVADTPVNVSVVALAPVRVSVVGVSAVRVCVSAT